MIYLCEKCGKELEFDAGTDGEDGKAICAECYNNHTVKDIVIDFLNWYYTESAKIPMRFETDHEDIAMMYLQERSR